MESSCEIESVAQLKFLSVRVLERSVSTGDLTILFASTV
jgi:hypothetical protein